MPRYHKSQLASEPEGFVINLILIMNDVKSLYCIQPSVCCFEMLYEAACVLTSVLYSGQSFCRTNPSTVRTGALCLLAVLLLTWLRFSAAGSMHVVSDACCVLLGGPLGHHWGVCEFTCACGVRSFVCIVCKLTCFCVWVANILLEALNVYLLTVRGFVGAVFTCWVKVRFVGVFWALIGP